MIVEKNGQSFEFWLDIEKAIDIEREKGVKFLDIIDSLNVAEGENPSLLAMDNACSALLGYSIPKLVGYGFTLPEIIGGDGLLIRIIKEADFMSATNGGSISSEPAPEGGQSKAD